MNTDFNAGSVLIGADMSCELYGEANCVNGRVKIRESVSDVKAVMVYGAFGDLKVKHKVGSFQCYVEVSEWNKPVCKKDATSEERENNCRSY